MDIKYSIIIPTLNRAANLKKCLICLLKINFNENLFEVIVINNGSTDDTERVVDSFKDKISCLRYFVSYMPGLHAGRNLGLQKARGDILCYIDDDSLVSKGWLKGIEMAFREPEVVLVGGPCLPQYEIEPPAWLNNMWNITEEGRTLGSLSLIDVGDEQRRISPYYVYGCNFSIRKDILAEIGGFHPDAMPKEVIRYRGDGETFVSKRLIESGYKAVYSPGAKIHHLVPASRMTTNYFCHRAYIQGISGSFTQKREQYGVENVIDKRKVSIGRKIYRRIKRVIKAKLNWEHHKNTGEPEEIRQIRAKMQESYEAGYRYHQEEVKKDPKLLEWVLRENYLGESGKLP